MAELELDVKPIETDYSLKARIYGALKDAITSMNIYDKDANLRLDERRLSERFGISRTPLREALARLDQEGLVNIVPRRGVFIVRKSKGEILEMITVWAALESMAARIITLNARDDEIATLRKLFKTFEDESIKSQIDEYSDANIRFHQAIIALSTNELIGRLTDDFFRHVRAIRQRTIFERDRAERSIIEHMEIIEAIEQRDSEAAGRLVCEHTLKLRDHVAAHVDLEF